MDPQRPTAELLIWAYSRGIFPMVQPRTGEIEWFSPDPRAVFPLDRFHVPRRLARKLRQIPFELRVDTAFERVMRACGEARTDRPTTWIDERLIKAYVELFEFGAAHSVEAWLDGQLVGGIYGVHLGAAFFGESMFHRAESGGTDASKACLVELVRILRTHSFELFDTQFRNPHLDQFGCAEITRDSYHKRLQVALGHLATWPESLALDCSQVYAPSAGSRSK